MIIIYIRRPIFYYIKFGSVQTLPKKDLKTGTIEWDTSAGRQCARRLRRLLIKPHGEPFLFVIVRFLSNERWWPLPFVDIKVDGQVCVK